MYKSSNFSNLILCFFIIFSSYANAADLKITTTIKPLQSIIQNITGDKVKVDVLLQKNDSPHNFSLSPEDARKIYDSTILFYISTEFETFMSKIIEDNDSNNLVNLSKSISNLKILNGRNKNFWQDTKAKKEDVEHDHHKDSHSHEHDAHSHHHDKDYHIWLDTDNVILIANFITKYISSIDPENQGYYLSNFKNLLNRIDNLNANLNKKLKPYEQYRFIVMHDAYQYFDTKYNLSAFGTIMINPSVKPNAKTIVQLKKALTKSDIKCIFTEPQFPNKIVDLLVKGTNTKIGELDAEWGITNTNPPVEEAYFIMMHGLADNMISCFEKNKITSNIG